MTRTVERDTHTVVEAYGDFVERGIYDRTYALCQVIYTVIDGDIFVIDGCHDRIYLMKVFKNTGELLCVYRLFYEKSTKK